MFDMPKIRFSGFKDLLMSNPYNPALKLAEIARKILDQAKNIAVGDQKYQTFLILVLLERSLDKMRAAVPLGSSTEFPQQKQKLEKQLNSLREEIWKLTEELNPIQLRESLTALGENIKSRFIKK